MSEELLAETNQRLKQMENDYKHQQLNNESMVDGMEKRLVDLRSNIEQLQQMKQKLDQEKSQLIKTNEQLQLQTQESTNKQRYIDRDHANQIQRYENELKSVRARCESSIDLVRKENAVLKSQSSKTIDDLERKLSDFSDRFHGIQELFEQKITDQQMNFQNTIRQCENDYEKKMQILRQELNQKSRVSIEEKEQMRVELVNQIQNIQHQTRENEQQSIEKLDQAKQQNEEIKHQYEQMKNDLKHLTNLSVETESLHEKNKQKLVDEYEEFICQLRKQYSQKVDEYEKRIESLISKSHEQFKSIEDDFQVRYAQQQAIIHDQQKLMDSLRGDQNKAQIFHDQQCKNLIQQSTREKNEIKEQFDLCMKDLQKNFRALTSKKEQLGRKLSHLNEQHKCDLIECRLACENSIKGLLTNDVRLDLENTIHSLKQQVVYLQQRIAFLQEELQHYIHIYGHRS